MCKNSIIKAKTETGAMIAVLAKVKSDDWLGKMKLFDSVILPSALYGAEVWSLGREEAVERVQLFFLKRTLLLNRTAPGWAVRIETNRSSLKLHLFAKQLNWLLKILNMNESRLPYVCYRVLCQSKFDKNDNWVYCIRKKLRDICLDIPGFSDEFDEVDLSNYYDAILNRYAWLLREVDRQSALSTLTCQRYYSLNPNFEIADQLTFPTPVNRMRCLTQLRIPTITGVHLYFNFSKANLNPENICLACNSGLETLEHFFIECTRYRNLRAQYLMEYIKNIVDPSNQVLVLLSNLNSEKIKNVYLYCIEAIKERY